MTRPLTGYLIVFTVCLLPTSRADEANGMNATQALRLLEQHCTHCHNAEDRESGIQVDHLDGTFPDERIKLWEVIAEQIDSESMPPEDELQLSEIQRKELIEWIGESLVVARSRPVPKNGSVRRLTVTQYQNTLRDLLGLRENLSDILPADGVSKHGFTNQPQSLSLSPLLLEAYFDIAQQAFDLCVPNEEPPKIQSFQMDLGENINVDPYPDKLILGANSHLLPNSDFVVKQLVPEKEFSFEPVTMQTQWRFNEGYQGNATVRGWREYNSIYHAVFACMRGANGYPKGRAYTVVPEGLLLRPAVPSNGLFKIDSTYGPQANFKVSLRELPDQGRFRVTVTAAKYHDALLLDDSIPILEEPSTSISLERSGNDAQIELDESGVYQLNIDAGYDESTSGNKKQKGKRSKTVRVKLNNLVVSGDLNQPAFLVVRLDAGPLTIATELPDGMTLDGLALRQVPKAHKLASAYQHFEQSSPLLGVHLGLRRDCGTTMSPVGRPQVVANTKPQQFVFEGTIGNFPDPDVQPANDNYLAGLRDLGVRCEYTDGRDRPRLIIKSIRFEGPYFDSWPSKPQRDLFPENTPDEDPESRARVWIRSFASRAFRRPVNEDEQQALINVWKDSFTEHDNYQQAIKDVFIVVMTSPQFLFLTERSSTPEPEILDGYELASKLSYFLWNSPPDGRLLDLASSGQLHASVRSEVDRLVEDPKFHRFAHEFASQWLSLDKLEVVETDRTRYPSLTRYAKRELRKEPTAFLKFLIHQNLPARHLVQSNYTMANEVVADYYELDERVDSGFDFVPVLHDSPHLGGLLTHAGTLAGLSDGRESNPVKRGAWLARKIIDKPPADPPPNVPELEEDISGLSLRERLERHRNQKGCVKCHMGIDPWGMPFEQYDAGGRWKTADVDARSTLPDQTNIGGMIELKRYLAEQQIDQVAFSFVKHLAIYAIGRDLTYNEIEQLKSQCLELKSNEYRLQDLVHLVVASEPFMTK
ncbi:MAG: DUF1592 domain-containing protein [Planctomycetota bacterium]